MKKFLIGAVSVLAINSTSFASSQNPDYLNEKVTKLSNSTNIIVANQFSKVVQEFIASPKVMSSVNKEYVREIVSPLVDSTVAKYSKSYYEMSDEMSAEFSQSLHRVVLVLGSAFGLEFFTSNIPTDTILNMISKKMDEINDS
jgi:hypothetical protein